MNATDEGFSLSFHKNYKLGPTYLKLAIFSLGELHQTSPSASEGWNKFSVPIWSLILRLGEVQMKIYKGSLQVLLSSAPRSFAARSRVLARLVSLAQIGKLARRLYRSKLPHHFQCRVPHRKNSPFGLLQMKCSFSLQHSVRFQPFFKISTHLFSETILDILLSHWTEAEMLNDSPLFHTYPPVWCRYTNPSQTEVGFASLKVKLWTKSISFSFDMLTRSPPSPKHPLKAVDQAKLRG